jgi:hypothetical protein
MVKASSGSLYEEEIIFVYGMLGIGRLDEKMGDGRWEMGRLTFEGLHLMY